MGGREGEGGGQDGDSKSCMGYLVPASLIRHLSPLVAILACGMN